MKWAVVFLILIGSVVAGHSAFVSFGTFIQSGASGDPTLSVLPTYDDAYANWSKAGLQPVGGIPNRTTVCDTISHGDAAFTITTSQTNDIIVLFFGGNGFPAATVSGVSSPNTTGWTQRGSSGQLSEWVGKASSVLTKEPITVTISGSPIYWVGVQMFAISGANFSSPFDSHSGLPTTGNPVSISTSNTGTDLIVGGYLYGTGTPTAGSGWTGIGVGWNGVFAQYQTLTGAQSSLAVTRGFAASTSQSGIADAFVQASGGTIAIDGYETGTPIASGDDSALITNAVASCPPGDVVQMNSGTFTVTGTNLIYLSSNVTLRGTGSCNAATGDQTGSGHTPYCASVIDKTDGWTAYTGTCVSTCNSTFAMVEMTPFHELGVTGPAWSGCSTSGAIAPGVGGCAGVELDADAAQGATTVQVHSTTPFSVGMQVKIDEASGGQWVTDPAGISTDMYASLDFLNSAGAPATGREAYNKYDPPQCCGDYPNATGYPYNSGVGCDFVDYGLNCDRATSEIHTISAIGAGPCPGTNCTITFDSPLTIAMRRSGAVSLTGSISGTTLTTSGDPCTMSGGSLILNTNLTDTTVAGGTYVSTINSCSGGVGNYTVTQSQTVPSESLMGAAHEAVVYYPSDSSGNQYTMSQYIGLENLTVEQGDHGEVRMYYCNYCWLKNVDVEAWSSGIVVQNSVRNEIVGSMVHDGWNNVNTGSEYPFDLSGGSTEILFHNSITLYGGKGMVARAGGAGSVVSYNYLDREYYLGCSGCIGDWLLDMEANGTHLVGPHHILFEGNQAPNCDGDNTHGNSTYHTFFRNQCTTYRSTFVDPSNGGTVNDIAGTNPSGGGAGRPLRAAGPYGYDYWYAYVGNSMGVNGVTTPGAGWQYQTQNILDKEIWLSGNGSAFDPNLTSFAYMWRHGNWDSVNGSIVDWSTSGCGAGACSHTLPNSFYTSTMPAYFNSTNCAYPWPWVVSTNSSSAQIQSPSNQPGQTCAASDGLPAKARWDAGTPFIQP